MTPDQIYFAVALVGMTLLLVLLHLGRGRLTLGPFFGLAGVFSMMQWQLLQTGWWVRIADLQFNAGLSLFIPTLLLGGVVAFALDGLRAARAYMTMVLTTASAAWLFSIFREALSQYVPLPYLLVLSNHEHLAIIGAIALGQLVGFVAYAALRSLPACLGFAVAELAAILCWLLVYSFGTYGFSMGRANLYNETLPMLLAALPSLAAAYAYGLYARRAGLLMPVRDLRTLLIFWRHVEPDQSPQATDDAMLNRDLVVSELRLLNDALKQNSRIMDAHLDHAAYGILVTDLRGRIRRVNPAAQKIFGDASLVGRPLLPLLEEFFATSIGIERLTADGAPRRWQRPNADGQAVWYELVATPLGEGRGGGGLYLIVSDVSDLVAEEQRRLHSHRVKDIHRTSRVLVHDFSNLLVGAQAHARGIRERARDKRTMASIEAIEAALRNAREMLQQLGGGSQFGTPRLARADLRGLLDETLRICEASAEEAGVGLELECGSGLAVEVDASQITRVFTNLVKNAIRASASGGRVRVEAGRKGSGVEIRVIDEGSGMTEAQLQLAFEPGFSTKGDGQGGLGLAISYLMVDAHGGSLELRQRENSPGMCATVWLPVRRSDAMDLPEDRAVIVVGSESEALEALIAELEGPRRCRVAEAQSGEEVLALMGDDPDWQMLLLDPALAGADWLERLPYAIEVSVRR